MLFEELVDFENLVCLGWLFFMFSIGALQQEEPGENNFRSSAYVHNCLATGRSLG